MRMRHVRVHGHVCARAHEATIGQSPPFGHQAAEPGALHAPSRRLRRHPHSIGASAASVSVWHAPQAVFDEAVAASGLRASWEREVARPSRPAATSPARTPLERAARWLDAAAPRPTAPTGQWRQRLAQRAAERAERHRRPVGVAELQGWRSSMDRMAADRGASAGLVPSSVQLDRADSPSVSGVAPPRGAPGGGAAAAACPTAAEAFDLLSAPPTEAQLADMLDAALAEIA